MLNSKQKDALLAVYAGDVTVVTGGGEIVGMWKNSHGALDSRTYMALFRRNLIRLGDMVSPATAKVVLTPRGAALCELDRPFPQ